MVLGSRNSKFCVLLNLSLFLEKWLWDGVGTISQWLFADGTTFQMSSKDAQEQETERCKIVYSKTLKSIIDDTTFQRSPLAGKLGTHSIQKYSAMVARKSSVSKEQSWLQSKLEVKENAGHICWNGTVLAQNCLWKQALQGQLHCVQSKRRPWADRWLDVKVCGCCNHCRFQWRCWCYQCTSAPMGMHGSCCCWPCSAWHLLIDYCWVHQAWNCSWRWTKPHQKAGSFMLWNKPRTCCYSWYYLDLQTRWFCCCLWLWDQRQKSTSSITVEACDLCYNYSTHSKVTWEVFCFQVTHERPCVTFGLSVES